MGFSWCCLQDALLNTVYPLLPIAIVGIILWLIERKFHVFYILSHKVSNRNSTLTQ